MCLIQKVVKDIPRLKLFMPWIAIEMENMICHYPIFMEVGTVGQSNHVICWVTEGNCDRVRKENRTVKISSPWHPSISWRSRTCKQGQDWIYHFQSMAWDLPWVTSVGCSMPLYVWATLFLYFLWSSFFPSSCKDYLMTPLLETWAYGSSFGTNSCQDN